MTNKERIAQVKGFIKELESRTDFLAELQLASFEAHLGELEKQVLDSEYESSQHIWAVTVDMHKEQAND